jgi:hypothetical protein
MLLIRLHYMCYRPSKRWLQSNWMCEVASFPSRTCLLGTCNGKIFGGVLMLLVPECDDRMPRQPRLHPIFALRLNTNVILLQRYTDI